jgi:WD40 repeat protein
MLGYYGEVLVMDWGLAASVEEHGKAEHITRTHRIGGTPAYMAPEQARNDVHRIGTQTDVYLLGGMLFRTVTGHAPHTGQDAMSCIMNAAGNVIRMTSGQGELLDIALRAMGTDPADRYQTVAEFRREIRGYRSHAESLRLAQEARRSLEQARSEGAYDQFARAMFAYEDALALWPGNEGARQGLYETRRSYAECAFEGGDHELALSVLPPEEAGGAFELMIRNAIEERDRRRKAIRTLKVTVASLAAVLIVALTIGFVWIRTERDRTEAARQDAEAAAEAELAQRRVAETEKDRAEREAYFSSVRLAAVKLQERAFDAAAELLAGCPPSLRGWEWGFIDQLCRQAELTYGEHGAQVEALAVAPGGSCVASGDWLGWIHMWQPDSGVCLRRIRAHSDVIDEIVFAPDGSWLASASDDGKVALWDSATGEQLAVLEGHTGEVWSVAVSPDGRNLASCGMDGTVRIWAVPEGEPTAMLKMPEGVCTAVAFSPQGHLAYSSGKLEDQGRITILRAQAWQEMLVLEGHPKHVNCLAFSPDGRALASGGWEGRVITWDTRSGSAMAQMQHDGPVFAVSYSADGARLCTGSEDRIVRIWDVAGNRLLRTLTGHSGPVGAAAFLPDGRHIMSASTDGSVKVWDSEKSTGAVLTLEGHIGAVAGVAFSRGGDEVASAGQDGTVRLWDPDTGNAARTLETGAGAGNGVAFLPDGRVATACWDGSVVVSNKAVNNVSMRINAHDGVARCVAVSPGGDRLATGGWDGRVKLWSVASGEEEQVLQAEGSQVQAVAFSSDGARVAAAMRDGSVRVWETVSGRQIASMSGHAGCARAVAFSPDGNLLASAGDDSLVRLWDARTGAALAALKGHTKWVKCLAFSPEGARLVSADDGGMIKVWDVGSGRDLVAWPAHRGVVWSVAFSPDGRTICSGGADGSAKLWRSLGYGDL